MIPWYSGAPLKRPLRGRGWRIKGQGRTKRIPCLAWAALKIILRVGEAAACRKNSCSRFDFNPGLDLSWGPALNCKAEAARNVVILNTKRLRTMKSIPVECEGRSYKIHVGLGMLTRAGRILKDLNLSKRLVVISNRQVLKLYGRTLDQSFRASGFDVSIINLPNGERYKSLATIEKIYHRLLQLRLDRKSTLVAFGGGVVGDMVGFAAATYLRGIACIQIPTTLLAQIDSAIGGKTGVNLKGGKNLVGAFYQPMAVIADPSLLVSLPARQFHSGLYEAIKYGIIRSSGLFDLIAQKHSRFPHKESTSLEQIVAECAAIKADVVSADERESGVRMILNYGHTIGHALEAATQYRLLTHGEAIGHGMIMATLLAEALGKIDKAESQEMIRVVKKLSPLPSIRSLRPLQIFRYMLSDKKIIEQRLRFVLPVRIGAVEIVSDVPRSAVDNILRSYLHARS